MTERRNAARTVSESPPAGAVTLTVDEALHMGLKLHQAGSLAEAETLYRRILGVEPEELNALHFLGLLCHQQDRKAEAASLIERIVAIDPQNADAHNNLGNVLEGLGKCSEAEVCYRKAISLRPDHAPAHNNLGVVLMAQKRVPEAVEAYRRAVALAPDSADFRYNLGNALRLAREIGEAVAAYQEAIALKPDYARAWRGLARSFLQAGRREEAAGAFEGWLRVDPGNPLALYLQAACVGRGAPARAPDAYIHQVFDDMAERFDSHLENLDYRAPTLLIEALAAALPPPSSTLEILDAGCGTGLCGPLLRPYAKRLTGVDLSPGMLVKADGRKVYDDLIEAELTDFLGRQTKAYDVIASADTLCYFGALEPVFQAAEKALKPGGIFAFTLEDGGDEAPEWQLNPNARYAHAKSYVEGALAMAGLAGHSISSVVLRKEGKEPVLGHLVVVRKQPVKEDAQL